MRKLEKVGRAVLSATVGLTFAFGASNVAAHENKSGAFHLIPAALTIYSTSDQQRDDASSKTIEGDWEGTIDAGVAKLRLVLHVVKKDGVLSATLDSPDQGATGLPIDAINIFVAAVRFEMKSLGAAYEGQLTKDESQIEGEWKQQGQTFPLVFKRSGVPSDKTGSAQSPLKLQKVDAGGHSLNLLIGGQASKAGAPAIVLEGGFGAGIASWSTVQNEIAKFAQVVCKHVPD